MIDYGDADPELADQLVALFTSLWEISSHPDFCEANKDAVPDTWRAHFQRLVDVTYKAAQELYVGKDKDEDGDRKLCAYKRVLLDAQDKDRVARGDTNTEPYSGSGRS